MKTETSNLQTFADAIRRIDECIEIDGKIVNIALLKITFFNTFLSIFNSLSYSMNYYNILSIKRQ